MVCRACSCGCEEAFPPMRYLNGHSGRCVPKFYANRHHRRGAKHVGRTGHERDVASSVVMEAVAARGVAIRRLAEWTGIAPIRLYRFRSGHQPWMRRATADRILVAVRHVATLEVQAATAREQARDRKRRQREAARVA